MDNKPLFSVIVPVYNVEKYIVQCLDSIVNQTFDDYEVLLVDDGSTDNSGRICDEYAEKYENVQVFHKPNGGQSSARNLGIQKSNGKYILFVDSDDWIETNYFNFIVDAAKKNNYDVILWSNVQEYDNHTSEKHIYKNNFEFSEQDAANIRKKIIGPDGSEPKDPRTLDILSPIWNKLYDAEIVKDNNISFNDVNKIGTFEDGFFNFEYFSFVKNAYYIDACIYHYRKNNSASSTAICRTDLFEKWDNLFYEIKKTLDSEKAENIFYEALNNRIVLSVFMLASIALKSNNSYFKKVGLLNTIFDKDLYNDAIRRFNTSNMSFFWKIYFSIVKLRKASLILPLNYAINIAAKVLR